MTSIFAAPLVAFHANLALASRLDQLLHQRMQTGQSDAEPVPIDPADALPAQVIFRHFQRQCLPWWSAFPTSAQAQRDYEEGVQSAVQEWQQRLLPLITAADPHRWP